VGRGQISALRGLRKEGAGERLSYLALAIAILRKMLAGSAGLLVGIFLGMAIARAR